MNASAPPAWAIRTIPRADLVDDILAMHFGFCHGGMTEAAARADVEATLDRWLALGLGHARGADGAPRFDPVETMNFMVSAGVEGRDDFWERNHVANERAKIRALMRDPATPAEAIGPDCFAPRRYRFRLERDYNLAGIAAGTRVRLRLPLPVEDAMVRLASVDVHAPAGAKIRREAARIDAGYVLERPGIETLAATIVCDTRADDGTPGPLTEAERERYTRPHEDMVEVTDRIRQEAATLATGLPEDGAVRVEAILAMFVDRFRLGAVPYGALDRDAPSEWPLDSGFFDCQIAAALFCSLCRALGIPARLCGGFQLYVPNTSYHYWAQAWLPDRGWLTFDPSFWHLTLAGRDARWRGVLLGWADPRLMTQVFPDLFTGASTCRLPPEWHRLRKHLPGGIENRFVDAMTGELVYRERLVHLPD